MKNKFWQKLQLQAEIDYWHWILSEMLKSEKKRDVLAQMIDKATGYDKKKLKDAKQIIAKVEKLKKKFYTL